MKRKILSIALLATSSLALASCGSATIKYEGGSVVAEKTTDKEKIKEVVNALQTLQKEKTEDIKSLSLSLSEKNSYDYSKNYYSKDKETDDYEKTSTETSEKNSSSKIKYEANEKQEYMKVSSNTSAESTDKTLTGIIGKTTQKSSTKANFTVTYDEDLKYTYDKDYDYSTHAVAKGTYKSTSNSSSITKSFEGYITDYYFEGLLSNYNATEYLKDDSLDEILELLDKEESENTPITDEDNYEIQKENYEVEISSVSTSTVTFKIKYELKEEEKQTNTNSSYTNYGSSYTKGSTTSTMTLSYSTEYGLLTKIATETKSTYNYEREYSNTLYKYDSTTNQTYKTSVSIKYNKSDSIKTLDPRDYKDDVSSFLSNYYN